MEYHSSGSLPLLGRPRYCPGANANGGYLCETGHCCGESGCCTYYYELWWFWLLWTVLILFSCCCAYRHRRAKLRVQQQQRQRDISLLAYQGASSFPSSMLDLSFLASLKLPSYEEVAAQPSTPPPPYSSVFTAPRYPQPPRSAHPHLLSQHPGTAPHRSIQPLSDGPSSLSSDNSSSCSCDSCCPSSPCSSSLSAPVTYETDTSHASTPSEATPLALDPVAMETISAAAARLSSKDPSAAVAILIERTDPAAAATECVTAVAAGSASPSETKASLDLDATFPVGVTLPVKQQLDVAVSSPTLQSTEQCGPDASSNPSRTLENTSFQQPRTLTLILDSAGGNTDKNPSLVPISVSPQNPPRAVLSSDTNVPTKSPNTSPSQTSPLSRTDHTDTNQSPNQSPKFTDCSSPSQGIAHYPLKPAGEPSELTTEAPNVTKQSEECGCSRKSPSFTVETTSQAPVSPKDTNTLLDVFGLSKQTVELSKSIEVLTADADPANEKADTSTLGTSRLSPPPQNSSETVTSPLKSQNSSELFQNSKSHEATAPNLTQDPTIVSREAKLETPIVAEMQEFATTPPEPSQPTENVSITMPDPSNSECPTSLSQDALAICQEAISQRIPPESTPTKANPIATDVVSPILDQETGMLSVTEQVRSELLILEQTVANLGTQDETYTNVTSPTFDQEKGKLSVITPLNLEHSNAQSSISPANSSTTDVVLPTLDCDSRIMFATKPLDSGLLNLEHSNPSATFISSANSLTTDVMSPTFNKDSARLFAPKPVDSGLLHLEHPNPTNFLTKDVISASSDRETNFEIEQNPVELLNLEHSLANLAAQKENANSPDASSATFPAITIQADPPSFAGSPCSIPSLPQSPSANAMLLLDPLSALQPSDKSAASSGHASSLSPSPRNTQSPPKQTLFSPCVDVFEPVNPNWEDDESEEQNDEEYCEDSDVAADESQYRHRRLTGDSGIEVCRCRVEDEEEEGEEEEEEEEDLEKVKAQDGGEKVAELHDSVDCPVRSRRGSLCNSEASSEKVAIPVETV